MMFELHDIDEGHRYCPECKVDREPESIEDGCCVFCSTYIAETAIPPHTGEERTGIRPTTKPEVRLANERVAFDMPYDAPTAQIDPNIERELASRVHCRRRLMPFIKKFRPKYKAGWVHEDICRRLERFVKAVERGEEPRMLLMMPPRGGKSEIGSRHFPPWVLGRHPDWEIIAGSHTSSLTMSFSRYVRDLVRDPAYTAIFPNAVLDSASQSVENWNLLAGGGYLAAGVGTGITGRGAHILLLDDLVKDIEAADSSTIRDNTWEWYISTAYTRLAPGGGVLGIMTWWNEDDWAGRIQQVMNSGEGDKFEIVRYPAINEAGDEYILTDETIVEIIPGHPVPPGATLTRPHNTALHPDRYSTETMLKYKRNFYAAGQKRIWSSLYQQNPAPDEGVYFGKQMFKYFTTPPERTGRFIAQAWDFAITEDEQNDYTVGCTLLQDEFDNCYVLDVRRFKSADGEFIVDEILNYAREWDSDLIGLEDGQIWKSIFSTFERRCQERTQYPNYEILVPLTDKFVRAGPLKGRMQAGKVFFNAHAHYWNDLQHEMLRFPASKHDDQVDSLAWGIRTLLTRAAPRIPDKTPKKIRPWKDRLNAMANGELSHMAA